MFFALFIGIVAYAHFAHASGLGVHSFVHPGPPAFPGAGHRQFNQDDSDPSAPSLGNQFDQDSSPPSGPGFGQQGNQFDQESSGPPSAGRHGHHGFNRQRFQQHQQRMVEEFHRIMEAAVQSWNELGDTINRLADNVDNRLDGQGGDDENGGNGGGRRGRRGLWHIVPQTSLLLETVNMQLESMVNQINKGLTRINKKCKHGHGGRNGGGNDQESPSDSGSDGSGSGGVSAGEPASPESFEDGGNGGDGGDDGEGQTGPGNPPSGGQQVGQGGGPRQNHQGQGFWRYF